MFKRSFLAASPARLLLPALAVLALGGCQTTGLDDVTGVLVRDESVSAFAEGLARVRSLQPDPAVIRSQAERFSRSHFINNFQAAVASALAERETAR